MQSQECHPELFSEILDNSQDLVTVVDSEGRVLYANELARSLGQKEGAQSWDWLQAEQRSQVEEALETLGQDGGGRYEFWNETPQGRRLFSGRIVGLSRGLLAHFVRDVTERRQATIAHEATAEQYQAVFHATTDALLIMRSDGTVTDVNRAACEMHGFTREEFLALSPTDFIHPESIPTFQAYAEALRRGERYSCEAKDLRKDGTAFEIEVQGFPFRYQGELQMLGVVKEVSRRKRAERELRESEQRKATMIRSALDGILTLDDQGLIREINPAAQAVFGPGQEGRALTELLSPKDFAGQLAERFSGQVTDDRFFDQHHECKARTSSGGLIAIEISVTPLKLPNQLEYMVSLRDIEERNRLSAQLQQAQKMEVLGQLTGGVAHDFNNLLTAMIGNLALIEEMTDDPEKIKVLAGKAMKAANRAGDLTHRLLAFSRKQPLRPMAINVRTLLAGMGDLLQSSLGENVEIRTRSPDELWNCEVDPNQLENTLLNLAINARDAMPDGGSLEIAASNVELDTAEASEHEVEAGEFVLVAVKDSGCGIAEEVLPHVFDPFFSTKEMGKGSGLGLSMVYGFVKQSNGLVRISSEPGEGTTVRLFLPKAETQPEPFQEPVDGVIPQGGGELILVVEDDEAVRFVTVNLLHGLGYRTLEAGDTASALKLLAEHSDLALLLTDVVLTGGMSGVQLAELAAAQNPDLPILYTSGYTANALDRRGRLAPGVKLLEKPFNKEKLALYIWSGLSS